MKSILFSLISLLAFSGLSQTNLTLQSQTDYDALHSTKLNDVWGYVDENNNEYALVGARKGTSIVDVTNPTAPNEVYWLPGMNSIWRDLKTWGDYCYVTTEAEQGLTIIDMSPLPASTTLSPSLYFGPSGNEWQSAHNIYIDENGYAYIFGANRGNGGVIILDVATDPLNPIEVGEFDNWYCHDGYVINDTMYLAHIYEGTITVVDVTDKANPVLLGSQSTPSNFAHNIWPSDDGNFVFTTDEVAQAYIAAYDVSDPANIFEVDRTQVSPGTGTVPHNVHVLGDFLVTSHYADGIVVHDISDPSNMVLVGEYDTHVGQEASTTGNWGAYPFLPSGVILATDINTGLYVLDPNYEYAAKLDGTVRDASTLNDLFGVSVQITAGNQVELTDLMGEYQTGILSSGTYDVTYSKVAYYPQTVSVTLTQGASLTQDIDLVPIPPFTFSVNVVEEGTGNPIIGADIRLDYSLITHEDQTNGLGTADFDLYYEDMYDVTIGAWGYRTYCETQTIDASTGVLNIVLEKGIYDDFSFDNGWTSSGSASTGLWERAIPFGTGSEPLEPQNADMDSQNDCGKYAFVTGNENNTNSDIDDVDEGSVVLVSPVFDVSSYSDPYIFYERWFFNLYGPGAVDDTLAILVSDGTQTITIDKIGSDPSTFHKWNQVSIRLSDYVNLTSTMQVFITTSDFDPDVNITEAGFDNFQITEGDIAGIAEEISENEVVLYPNPTNGILNLSELVTASDVKVFDLFGRIVWQSKANTNITQIDVSQLPSSTYIIQIEDTIQRFVKY